MEGSSSCTYVPQMNHSTVCFAHTPNTVLTVKRIEKNSCLGKDHFPHNHSGTNAGFECLFPVSIISPLYDTKDFISFSTWLEIEWIAQVN